jgi:hypothetical protein
VVERFRKRTNEFPWPWYPEMTEEYLLVAASLGAAWPEEVDDLLPQPV